MISIAVVVRAVTAVMAIDNVGNGGNDVIDDNDIVTWSAVVCKRCGSLRKAMFQCKQGLSQKSWFVFGRIRDVGLR